MKNNILNILNEKKISIRQLSKDLDLSYSYTHGLVNREDLSTVQVGTLLNIANYLEVDITKLYEGEKKMIRLVSENGNWNIIIDEIEYHFYYSNIKPIEGLILNGLDEQLEEYLIGGNIITATKEKYIYNDKGYRYILNISR